MSISSSNVTSYDVARVAQVSVGTVIRVLNQKPNVDAEIRDRVLRAVEELGYVYVPKKRSSSAAGKIDIPLKSVMLCVPLALNPSLATQVSYYYTILNGAQQKCAEYNLHLTYNVIHDSIEGLAQIQEAIERGFADGIVLTNYGSRELIEGILQLQVPFVLIEPRIQPDFPVDVVTSDDFYGGQLAAEHLLGLGHRSIACICTVPQYVTQRRLAGYRVALSDAQMPFRPELFIRARTDLMIDEGEWAMQQLLNRGEAFSAVFCINDNAALGALRALHASGLRVPEDISVMSFDDNEGAALAVPALTTIHGATDEKGQIAIQRLIQRVQSSTSAYVQSVLPVRLVMRASTAPLSQ